MVPITTRHLPTLSSLYFFLDACGTQFFFYAISWKYPSQKKWRENKRKKKLIHQQTETLFYFLFFFFFSFHQNHEQRRVFEQKIKMSVSADGDFGKLESWVLEEKKIVTYRWLAQTLAVSVNKAKRYQKEESFSFQDSSVHAETNFL